MAEDWDVSAIVASRHSITVRETHRRVRLLRVASVGRLGPVPVCPSLPLYLCVGRYDCVVLHEPNPLAAAALMLHTPARRLIIWHHADVIRPDWQVAAYRRIQHLLYARADCVVVSSPYLARHSSVLARARRVEVIPFGIDVSAHEACGPERVQLVRQLQAMHSGPRVLFVGRLVHYKGLPVLLRAMSHCDGSLILVGEGPLRAQLRDQARALGIEHRVSFVSGLSDEDLRAYYDASDIFVLPSVAHAETFGIVQVEAMASGLPVVSTNLPTGVPWVNQDGRTGFVVPPGDFQALADAIRRLAADPNLRARMGAAGRERARERFSRQRMIRDFAALVENVVGGRMEAVAGAAATDFG
jgi:rhamnosyl/mannosyltransferase